LNFHVCHTAITIAAAFMSWEILKSQNYIVNDICEYVSRVFGATHKNTERKKPKKKKKKERTELTTNSKRADTQCWAGPAKGP